MAGGVEDQERDDLTLMGMVKQIQQREEAAAIKREQAKHPR